MDTGRLVRLQFGDPPVTWKGLDAGVQTVLVTGVETADEVLIVAEAMRYQYDGSAGEQGVGKQSKQNAGALPPDQDEREDESVSIDGMIENWTVIDRGCKLLSVGAARRPLRDRLR